MLVRCFAPCIKILAQGAKPLTEVFWFCLSSATRWILIFFSSFHWGDGSNKYWLIHASKHGGLSGLLLYCGHRLEKLSELVPREPWEICDIENDFREFKELVQFTSLSSTTLIYNLEILYISNMYSMLNLGVILHDLELFLILQY